MSSDVEMEQQERPESPFTGRDSHMLKTQLEVVTERTYPPQYRSILTPSSATSSIFIDVDQPIRSPDFPGLTPTATLMDIDAPSDQVYDERAISHAVPHPLGELRAMANELAQARQNGEFPKAFGPSNYESVVSDYTMLVKLREARGDPSVMPASRQYQELRVAVEREIRHRDGECTEDTKRRLSEKQLGSLNGSSQDEQYRRCEIVQAALQDIVSRGSKGISRIGLQDIAEEVYSIVESAMADTTLPIRNNLQQIDNVLGGQIETVSAQLSTLSSILNGQINTLSKANNNLNTAIDHIPDMIQPAVYGAARGAAAQGIADGFRALNPSVQSRPPRLTDGRHGYSPLSLPGSSYVHHDISSSYASKHSNFEPKNRSSKKLTGHRERRVRLQPFRKFVDKIFKAERAEGQPPPHEQLLYAEPMPNFLFPPLHVIPKGQRHNQDTQQ